MKPVTDATHCTLLQETGLQRREECEAGFFPLEDHWLCKVMVRLPWFPVCRTLCCPASTNAQWLWSCASVQHSRLQPSLDDFADAGVAHEMSWDEPWCSSRGKTGTLYPEEQSSGFLFQVPQKRVFFAKGLGLMQLAEARMLLCFKINGSFPLPSIENKGDNGAWEPWRKCYQELCG